MVKFKPLIPTSLILVVILICWTGKCFCSCSFRFELVSNESESETESERGKSEGEGSPVESKIRAINSPSPLNVNVNVDSDDNDNANDNISNDSCSVSVPLVNVNLSSSLKEGIKTEFFSSNASSSSHEYDGDSEEISHQSQSQSHSQVYGNFNFYKKLPNISKIFTDNIQNRFKSLSPKNRNQNQSLDDKNNSKEQEQEQEQNQENESRRAIKATSNSKSSNGKRSKGRSKSRSTSRSRSRSRSLSDDEQCDPCEKVFKDEEEDEEVKAPPSPTESYRATSPCLFSRLSLLESTSTDNNNNESHERARTPTPDDPNTLLQIPPNISTKQLEQINLIDQLASKNAQKYCPHVGIRILELLLEQSKQLLTYEMPVIVGKVKSTPTVNSASINSNISNSTSNSGSIGYTANSVLLAFELLNQLVIVYAVVVESNNSRNNLEFIEIIEKCLLATVNLFDHYDLRIVRDTLLLLILNNPHEFDEGFLRKERIKKLFKKIIQQADSSFIHINSLDYIRQIYGLSNFIELQKKFKVVLKTKDNDSGPNSFISLNQFNLSNVKTKARTETEFIKSTFNMNSSSYSIRKRKIKKIEKLSLPFTLSKCIWDNRYVLFLALFLAIFIQYFFLSS